MIGFQNNVGLIYSFVIIFTLIEIDSFFTYADDRSPERYKGIFVFHPVNSIFRL